MKNYNAIYPENCRAILDVTKPPYNVDNTGRTDCTKVLIQIFDDVLNAYRVEFERTRKKLEAMADPNAHIGFEIRKIEGRKMVIFPEVLPSAQIIYFPEGIYLVSDTISYSFAELRNIHADLKGFEMNCQIHFMGQSREKTIIKLQDHCKGFEFGANRPVISFMRGEASNIAMTNTFENITIDTGIGNAGAIGLIFFGNNTGGVNNVTIRSGDPEFIGYAGLQIVHEIVSGCYIKDIEVVGFDYGVMVMPVRNFTVFEHIHIENQRRVGFYIQNTITSIRDLNSTNKVTALRINGPTAHVVLTDATLIGKCEIETALRFELGICLLRNIHSEGYQSVLQSFMGDGDKYSTEIDEYTSHGVFTLYDKESCHSLALKVEEPPEILWEQELSQWAGSDSYAAVGDGITDDTQAIQEMMNSGKPVIFFQPGHYKINGVISIPASVKRINFMFCDLVAGEDIKNNKNDGVFTVSEDSSEALLMENLFTWEQFHGSMRLIHHKCKRTLFMRNIHVQTAAIYFNTVKGGKVFIENTACTVGSSPFHKSELKSVNYREIPCFSFTGQKVWARHINPERSLHEIVNDGGSLWIMGFKSEGDGTAFETRNGGETEILGGTISMGTNKLNPAVINDNSNVSVVASTNGYALTHVFPVAICETLKGRDKWLLKNDFPKRMMDFYTIPLYVGRINS